MQKVGWNTLDWSLYPNFLYLFKKKKKKIAGMVFVPAKLCKAQRVAQGTNHCTSGF